jgi:hypothetical protein
MLVSEIISEARGILQEPDQTFYTDAEFIAWINRALLDFCRLSQLIRDSTTFLSVADQADYDYPTGFLKVMYLKYKDTKLVFQDIPKLERFDSEWLSAAAVAIPSYYYFFKYNKISIYPKPNTTDDIMSIYYIRKATAITADTQTPEIPEEYHYALEDYALAMAKMKDGQYDQAQVFMNNFNAHVYHAKTEGKRLEKYDKVASFGRYIFSDR